VTRDRRSHDGKCLDNPHIFAFGPEERGPGKIRISRKPTDPLQVVYPV